MMKLVRVVPMILALASCGDTADLRPAPGQSLPVKPAMASKTPTPEELLAPTALAHPERVDELMRRSEPRRADRFDLPPPDGSAPTTDPVSANSSDDEAKRVPEPK